MLWPSLPGFSSHCTYFFLISWYKHLFLQLKSLLCTLGTEHNKLNYHPYGHTSMHTNMRNNEELIFHSECTMFNISCKIQRTRLCDVYLQYGLLESFQSVGTLGINIRVTQRVFSTLVCQTTGTISFRLTYYCSSANCLTVNSRRNTLMWYSQHLCGDDIFSDGTSP